ncbi:aspartate aminotransferase family protein [Desulfosediminicola flagellatus]|uniref:aminotransferase family protein n=1 Tax=Desulfosediminicola flagellatus TaxID=2569541 RepID=UPI0010AB5FC3|nr:aminotransferase class III-fold pyridoxal phosphate-dependent enzyme [Desulfosediminicola flagellatus]
MNNNQTTNPLFYQTNSATPMVSRAEGIYIWDEAGKEYIDGCSGAIICNIGHGDERVLATINAQAQSTFFTYRTQFENRPAVELAQKLVDYSASRLDRVFYVSGGSEAVESAVKLCRSYFCSKGEGNRHLVISRTPSYHGSTLGALALTAYAPLEIPYRPMLKSSPKIPAPYCFRCHFQMTYPQCDLACARALETTIREQGPENVAAFIAEPIGGASTGALVPPEEYFAIIRDICDRYGILLILDEVMTGFGRTGTLFAYEHWNLQPDIVALSKGMASGYYPLGAIIAGNNLVESVLSGGGFPHGHTYAGNPMACAVGLTVLERITDDHLVENSAEMGKLLITGLQVLAEKHPIIGQVRGRGLLTALEFVQDRENRTPFPNEHQVSDLVTQKAFTRGLMIYPRKSINGLAGDHVLIAPPLIVTAAQIGEILNRLDDTLTAVTRSLAGKE